MLRFFSVLTIALMLFFGFLAKPILAQDDILGLDYADNFGLTTAEETDPKQMAIDITRYIMTFLGIIAVAIILYGGFVWMTASGNEDRVDKAKKIIIAGAVGLVIILAAFAIVTFVVSMSNSALKGEIG